MLTRAVESDEEVVVSGKHSYLYNRRSNRQRGQRMSSKQQTAVTKLMHLLKEWDKGSTNVRRKILREFIIQHQNKTGTELEEELAHSASLFFTRITAWLRLT